MSLGIPVKCLVFALQGKRCINLVDPYNVGIEDESINHALSDSEVEGTDEEHQQESCSCKENE